MNVEYRQYFFDLRGRILAGHLKPGVVVPKGVDNYGMRLKFLSEESSLQNRVAEIR
jgi:hypothetical protein